MYPDQCWRIVNKTHRNELEPNRGYFIQVSIRWSYCHFYCITQSSCRSLLYVQIAQPIKYSTFVLTTSLSTITFLTTSFRSTPFPILNYMRTIIAQFPMVTIGQSKLLFCKSFGSVWFLNATNLSRHLSYMDVMINGGLMFWHFW